MGVRGLLSFISNTEDFFKECTLKDSCIVVDGYNLMYHMYNACPRRNCCFGGDYKKYHDFLREFFATLLEHGIKPIVVLDGAFEDVKRRTLWQRSREQASRAVRCNPTSQSRHAILPILAKETFVNAVKCLEGVKIITTFFEADAQLATVANRLSCPVVSNDSDFFIFNVRVISIDSLMEATKRTCERKGLTCEEFDREEFTSKFQIADPEHLFLVAVLIGNDYVGPKPFERVFSQIALPKKKSMSLRHRKITGLMRWLSRQPSVASAIDHFMGYIPFEIRGKTRGNLERAVSMYRLRHEGICGTPDAVLEDVYSQELLMLLPKTIDDAFLRLHFFTLGAPTSMLDVLVNRSFFLPSQVEVEAFRSSHLFAKPIVEVCCAVALGFDEAHDEEETAIRMICRSGRKSATEPIVVRGERVKHLKGLDEVGKREQLIACLTSSRTKPMVETAGDDQWQLLLCSLCFWAENWAEVRPSPSHLLAVVLCTVIHDLGEQDNLATRSKELNWSNRSYAPDVVHCFANLQAVLYHSSALNGLLGRPQKGIDPTFWRGTLMYNAVFGCDSPDRLIALLSADEDLKSRTEERHGKWMKILELEEVPTKPRNRRQRPKKIAATGNCCQRQLPEERAPPEEEFVDMNNKFALLAANAH